MLVLKEIAEKAKEYDEVSKRANDLFEELEEYFNENAETEDLRLDSFFVADEPVGIKQQDGGYCNQTHHREDHYTGTYYNPIEDSKKYVAYTYSC